MISRLFIFWVALIQAAAFVAEAVEVTIKPLKRADSFLGMHFDFHAAQSDTNIGLNTTSAMIENIINRVHPDYLQIDCKGHPGYSSYPTKIGNPAPGIIGDPLRVWREVTARHGVGLYMHYSGVFDTYAAHNPDWAIINADGSTNRRATSFFGPYADKLLIPQLRELAVNYEVDGVWVDGECWAAAPDYSLAALKAFHDATGIQNVPRKPSDPHWFEFLQFNREAFRNYLRHYVTEVKKDIPSLEFCSNWAFTDHMPEAVGAPVDFLSGDYMPENSVNSARFSARYLVRQGKPWDLMAWSFGGKPARQQKSVAQLEREAAVVLALGGGFQAYFKQKRDGSIYDEQMPMMAEVAKFCRARQELCHHAEPVPQVALLLSTAAHYQEINDLFSRDNDRLSGVLNALLESQQSVEVVGEHQLTGRMSEYPLIVIPEWNYLEPQFKQELVGYVKAGGNVLVIGPKTAALFQNELGVILDGAAQSSGSIYLNQSGMVTSLAGIWQPAKLGANSEAFGTIYPVNNAASVPSIAASIAGLGRGKIAATYFTLGQAYFDTPNKGVRKFLSDLVLRLFPNPLVKVTGSSDVDVCAMRKTGQLRVNLVNTSGPHRTQAIIESITPVGPLNVSIRQAKKPAKITLEPSGQPLKFDYQDGEVKITVPKVEIHEVVLLSN